MTSPANRGRAIHLFSAAEDRRLISKDDKSPAGTSSSTNTRVSRRHAVHQFGARRGWSALTDRVLSLRKIDVHRTASAAGDVRAGSTTIAAFSPPSAQSTVPRTGVESPIFLQFANGRKANARPAQPTATCAYLLKTYLGREIVRDAPTTRPLTPVCRARSDRE